MANIFSSSEIVEIGIQIERNGRDFYNSLFDKSDNDKAKEIYKYLAGEEEKHISVFRDILDTVQKYEPAESYPGEYFSYINALADDYVFTKKNKGKEIAEKITNQNEAIDMGIKVEKDSILFYKSMKKVVPESQYGAIDDLIVQEEDHLKQLTDLKQTLNA
jgi:rubrerythrin